jgi:hypothetical protein
MFISPGCMRRKFQQGKDIKAAQPWSRYRSGVFAWHLPMR